MTTLKELNKKLKSNYDLTLDFIGDSKNLKCYLGSFMTKETEDLCFAQDYINRELHKGAKLKDLIYLPFFK